MTLLVVDSVGVGIVVPESMAAFLVNTAGAVELVQTPLIAIPIQNPLAVFSCSDAVHAMKTLSLWKDKSRISGLSPRKADWNGATYIGGAVQPLSIVN